jgi:hypothetical protein
MRLRVLLAALIAVAALIVGGHSSALGGGPDAAGDAAPTQTFSP